MPRSPASPARVASVDGLAYSLWLPDREPEGGVVIIHGADSRKESHHDFARLVRDAGLAAVAFDLRGHGESAKPHDPAAYGRARLAADVIGLTEALGLGRVLLMGYSMGAQTALEIALSRSDLVTDLVHQGFDDLDLLVLGEEGALAGVPQHHQRLHPVH